VRQDSQSEHLSLAELDSDGLMKLLFAGTAASAPPPVPKLRPAADLIQEIANAVPRPGGAANRQRSFTPPPQETGGGAAYRGAAPALRPSNHRFYDFSTLARRFGDRPPVTPQSR